MGHSDIFNSSGLDQIDVLHLDFLQPLSHLLLLQRQLVVLLLQQFQLSDLIPAFFFLLNSVVTAPGDRKLS